MDAYRNIATASIGIDFAKSFLFFLALYGLQVYVSRKQMWTFMITLPFCVIVAMVVKKCYFDDYYFPILDYASSVFIYCYLGGALGFFITQLNKKGKRRLD